jgi:hypothetical protein
LRSKGPLLSRSSPNKKGEDLKEKGTSFKKGEKLVRLDIRIEYLKEEFDGCPSSRIGKKFRTQR